MRKIDAQILTYEAAKSGKAVREVNEHPWLIRFTHWLNTISLFILIGSGLRIFIAFPSFGSKIPREDFFLTIPNSLTIGGWLGGALQWHFTFMWIYMITGLVYVIYQFTSGHWKRVLFTHKDVSGVLPMAKHYFLFRSKPEITEQYNPLQKLAYTSVIILGLLSVVTGLAIYKPVQFSFLTELMGGFGFARILHFVVMCAFILFVVGHVIMVVLHGWNNFVSMLTGWKREPEYLPVIPMVPAASSVPAREPEGGTEEVSETKAETEAVADKVEKNSETPEKDKANE